MYTFKILSLSDDEEKSFVVYYPFDLSAIFINRFLYINSIECQPLVDSKAPLFQSLIREKQFKNGSSCEIEPTHKIFFNNLEYKKVSKSF